MDTTTQLQEQPAPQAEPKGPGKIQQIIALHKAGKTIAEIVEAGFNKTTASIQIAKRNKDPKAYDKQHNIED